MSLSQEQYTGRKYMSLETMSNDEISLLLYLETCCVDHGGKVDINKMNDKDVDIAKRNAELGFISFGRIATESLSLISGAHTHWCQLSDDAWELVHHARWERAVRGFKNRKWKTTDEV